MPNAALLALLLAPSVAAPLGNASLQMRGVVPPVCSLSSQSASSADGTMTARLSVFCNQREGAAVLGTLMGGDPRGYLISNGRETVHVEPGAQFTIANYTDAHAGFEFLTVTPVAGGGTSQPALMFDIRAEG